MEECDRNALLQDLLGTDQDIESVGVDADDGDIEKDPGRVI